MFHTIGKRRLRYGVLGEGARTVCFVHALAADSGMWAEQVPPVLARGLRVLRVVPVLCKLSRASRLPAPAGRPAVGSVAL